MVMNYNEAFPCDKGHVSLLFTLPLVFPPSLPLNPPIQVSRERQELLVKLELAVIVD